MAEAWSEEAQQGMVVSQRSQFKEPAASGLQALTTAAGNKVEPLSGNVEELPDLERRFLDGRINNKQNRPFLERQTIVNTVLAELKSTQSKALEKPRLEP